jgi:Xaa-Pro aminopeptidase
VSGDDRFRARRARAVEHATAAEIDGLLVAPGPSLRYLTGYDPIALERLTLLVLPGHGAATLVVPELERPGALVAPGVDELAVRGWLDGADPFAIVAETLDGERWAISDEARGAHVLALQRARPGLELEPLETALPLLRAVKDEDELERLRAAARSADAAFADVVELGFAGRTEIELAADLDRLLREHGHERVGFTIVGSGPNAASSHHDSGERTIERGDAVVMDFGGVLDGYWSDLTRTVFVGEPTAEQREVYEVVREAQRSAFDAIRPGVTCEAVDRAARSVIEAAGYHERFVHRTGHGIGLDLHEPPYIVEGNETVLQAGMTFSDEPGIYLEGRFGVRIEDQVAVTATGAERLNEASREITIVG